MLKNPTINIRLDFLFNIKILADFFSKEVMNLQFTPGQSFKKSLNFQNKNKIQIVVQNISKDWYPNLKLYNSDSVI